MTCPHPRQENKDVFASAPADHGAGREGAARCCDGEATRGMRQESWARVGCGSVGVYVGDIAPGSWREAVAPLWTSVRTARSLERETRVVASEGVGRAARTEICRMFGRSSA